MSIYSLTQDSLKVIKAETGIELKSCFTDDSGILFKSFDIIKVT